MLSTDSRCVVGRENTLLQAHPCSFQPGNVTGWGSEGVKQKLLTNRTRNGVKNCCRFIFYIHSCSQVLWYCFCSPLSCALQPGYLVPRFGELVYLFSGSSLSCALQPGYLVPWFGELVYLFSGSPLSCALQPGYLVPRSGELVYLFSGSPLSCALQPSYLVPRFGELVYLFSAAMGYQ